MRVFLAFLGSSPESSRDLSPGVTSSPFLDRPIRPLPKRRLRERLSPEVAGSIQYPPALESTTPLFYYPYNPNDEPRSSGMFGYGPSRVGDREKADEAERNFIARRNGAAVELDEEGTAYRSRVYSRQTSETSSQAYRYMQQLDAKYNKPQPPGSAASSVDGYDSFENTNNKKKRKIPTPAMSSLAGGHLVNDLASMGISSNDDVFESPQAAPLTYNTSPSTPRSHGFSGPGRGRYGRTRNGRSPLRLLSDASSTNLGNGRLSHRQRQPQWAAGEGRLTLTCWTLLAANRRHRDATGDYIDCNRQRRTTPHHTFARSGKRQSAAAAGFQEDQSGLDAVHLYLRFTSSGANTVACFIHASHAAGHGDKVGDDAGDTNRLRDASTCRPACSIKRHVCYGQCREWWSTSNTSTKGTPTHREQRIHARSSSTPSAPAVSKLSSTTSYGGYLDMRILRV